MQGLPCIKDRDCGLVSMRCVMGNCSCYWAWGRTGARCEQATVSTVWVLSARSITSLSYLCVLLYCLHIICQRDAAVRLHVCAPATIAPLLVLASTLMLLIESVYGLFTAAGSISIGYDLDYIWCGPSTCLHYALSCS